MSVAIISDALITHTAPPFVIVDFIAPGVAAGAVYTELCEINLLAKSREHVDALLKEPNLIPKGRASVINPNSIAISCKSTNYDIRMFNKFGLIPDLLDSNYEAVFYDDLNLSIMDTNLGDFAIVNRDQPMTNKLYLYVRNNDLVNATDLIYITMTYVVMQDVL